MHPLNRKSAVCETTLSETCVTATHDERNEVYQYDFSLLGQSSLVGPPSVVIPYTPSLPPAWCAEMRRYLNGDASAWDAARRLFFEQRGREETF